MIALLTFMNTRGLRLGKLVQNVFTTAKTGALIALILLGIIVGWKSGAGAENSRLRTCAAIWRMSERG